MSPQNSETFLQPEMLFNVDFRSSHFKKSSIENHINPSSTLPQDGLKSPQLKRKSPIETTKATSNKMNIFFQTLMKSDKKPAILWILPGHAKKFWSKSLKSPCKSLKNLYLNSCLNIPFKGRQNKSNKIFDLASISQEEASSISTY